MFNTLDPPPVLIGWCGVVSVILLELPKTLSRSKRAQGKSQTDFGQVCGVRRGEMLSVKWAWCGGNREQKLRFELDIQRGGKVQTPHRHQQQVAHITQQHSILTQI